MHFVIVNWKESINVALIDQFICEIQACEFNLKNADLFNFCIRSMKKYYTGPNNKVNFFIAFVNEVIVGCIGIRMLGKDEAELRKFYVHPSSREFGLGKHLFEIAIKAAIECSFQRIYTGTMDVKIKAQEFYKRNGFEEIERGMLPPNFQVQILDEKFFVRKISCSSKLE